MPLFQKKPFSVPDDLTPEELLLRAKATQNPAEKFACLSLAERIAPDSLAVARALLMHGRLHERDPKKLSYHIIKCYLFHAFEHPEEHDPDERRRMARELYDDPRLAKCLALCEDGDTFLRQYLRDLAAQYVNLFIAGDTRHVPSLLGYSIKARYAAYVTVPATSVIRNLLASEYLSESEQTAAASAMYRAFSEHVSGDTDALDVALGAELLARLAI